MRHARLYSFAALAVLTAGSLGTTLGWALYLRSGWYRRSCAERLSTHLGLPAEIGRVVPLGQKRCEFHDVRIWLPQRRGEAAFYERAQLRSIATADAPDAYEFELFGGHSDVSSRTWLQSDYRAVLESGLRVGFDPDGPRRVVFSGLDLTFERHPFRMSLEDASGQVLFLDSQHGRAAVACPSLNGHQAPHPVTLDAEFTPQTSGVRIDRLALRVPELPLAVVGLDRVTDAPLRTGLFAGELIYNEDATGNSVAVHGRVRDLELAECTTALLGVAWRGTAPEVELEALELDGGVPTRLRFRGVFTDVALSDILSTWQLDDGAGRATLRVREAELTPAGIRQLVASLHCDAVPLKALLAPLGRGGVGGTATLAVSNLTIVDNHLVALDARLDAVAPADAPNWIDRTLLSEITTRVLGVPLPGFLPERFEYTHCGFRLEVRDEQLRVYGTHGPREKVILTVLLAGREFPVVFEPEQSFDLTAPLDAWRAALTAGIVNRLSRLRTPEDWHALLVLPRVHPASSASPPASTSAASSSAGPPPSTSQSAADGASQRAPAGPAPE